MTDLALDGLNRPTLLRHIARLIEYGRPFDGTYLGQRWAGMLFDFDTKAGVALMLTDGRRGAVKIDYRQAIQHDAPDLAAGAVDELLTWASAA